MSSASGSMRVERVAGDERVVQLGEGLDVADVVEHHEAPADRGEHPDLAALHLDLAPGAVDQVAAMLEDVMQRAGVRARAVARRLGGDLLPHLALRGARLLAGGEPLAHALVLEPAQLGVGGLRRGRERLGVAAVVPAALLDAADRDRAACCGPPPARRCRRCGSAGRRGPPRPRRAGRAARAGCGRARSLTSAPPASSLIVTPRRPASAKAT